MMMLIGTGNADGHGADDDGDDVDGTACYDDADDACDGDEGGDGDGGCGNGLNDGNGGDSHVPTDGI